MIKVKVKQYWFRQGYAPHWKGFVLKITNVREIDGTVYVTTQKWGSIGTIDYSARRFMEVCEKLPWYKQLWYSFLEG